MTAFAYQVQRSTDGSTWVDIGGASGTFNAVSPFSHDVPYTIQSADANDYLRLKVTRLSDNVIQYSGLVGPVAPTAGGGGGGTPAAFPSNLHTSGQNIMDANNYVLPRLKGFNIQAAGWSQAEYDSMYAEGARLLRAMVFWDSLEPTKGSINSSFVSSLDTLIARAQAAGIYVMLCLYYGPNGVHKPSWIGGSQLHWYTDNNNGQFATQYLAKRYGDPADPLGAGKYTKTVIGFGINEPTPDSSGNSYLTAHLAEQHTMMTWFRTYAPNWIGVISCGYGGGCPLPNAPGSGQTSQTFTGAPDDPFSGIGNWVMDVHVYKEATTQSATRPAYDGRNAYGMPNSSTQIDVANAPYPPSGVTRAQCQAFFDAFFASHKLYCGPSHANVPLWLGEWGHVNGIAGGDQLAADLATATKNAFCAAGLQWDFNTNTSDKWCCKPGGTYQTATNIYMANT